jgi:hypothetical protein
VRKPEDRVDQAGKASRKVEQLRSAGKPYTEGRFRAGALNWPLLAAGEKTSKKNGREIMKQWPVVAPGKAHAHENESQPRTCPPKNPRTKTRPWKNSNHCTHKLQTDVSLT